MKTIYVDHAATTYPRAQEVIDAMVYYMKEIGCSPGRGGHRRSLDAARLIYETRILLSEFFNVPQPEQVVFTPSVTYALNLVLKGLLAEGDQVLISSMEHNAVVRPLTRLAAERGIQVMRLSCRPDGSLEPAEVKRALRANTKLLVLTHASNVTGTLLPVYEVGEILRGKDVFYCIDAAQTAGVEKLDFAALNCDYLAFTGQKGLLGPPGIGGLCLSARAAEVTKPLVEGGTGSRSEAEYQPPFLPDKFESGTQNVPGVAGLAAGVRLLLATGVKRVKEKKTALTAAFLAGLEKIHGITVYGTKNADTSAGVVSLNMEGLDNGTLSLILEQSYGIMTRPGLHCAPLAHKTIGTFPSGTLRFSFGLTNSEEDINTILAALQELAKEGT
ncbi:MAG: aminotransferase class V-fold PLP-dependent enzyme [Firmicutes bacterium]|nr:aminotransferase class V-fold PLP-dependent enzyme [Bacillota bacterium]